MINSWNKFLALQTEEYYYHRLSNFVEKEYQEHTIYPPKDLVFNAFIKTPLDKVKVVIVGQDPYHEPGQAMGLAFSVNDGVKLPPSLNNIYKEIESDLNVEMDYKSGNLTYLAEQGVLLLNSILTVEEGKPLSHDTEDYKTFYLNVIKLLNEQPQPIVFMLWGSKAGKIAKYLDNPNHLVLLANHPSPLSANRGGWFGCKHFSKCNEFLKNNNLEPINWSNYISLFNF